MSEKYILVSIENSKNIGEILGNKNCKKILSLLAEKEYSETDLSRELNLPLNTVEYNLKKLIQTGLVEKAKNFFWSRKGKRIPTYKAAKKYIVITHKPVSTIKTILPAALISVIISVIILIYQATKSASRYMAEKSSELMNAVPETAGGIGTELTHAYQVPVWLWFLAGSLIALIIFLILNWRKL